MVLSDFKSFFPSQENIDYSKEDCLYFNYDSNSKLFVSGNDRKIVSNVPISLLVNVSSGISVRGHFASMSYVKAAYLKYHSFLLNNLKYNFKDDHSTPSHNSLCSALVEIHFLFTYSR